jgi:protein TonB
MHLKIILFVLLTYTSFAIQAQSSDSINSKTNKTTYYNDTSDIYIFTSPMPEFIGGSTAFTAFIQENLSYPQEALKNNLTGTAYIEFIVEKDGTLSNIKEVKGREIDPILSKAAINVLSKSPNWTPGIMNNKPVRVKLIRPISFKITK